MGRRQIRERVKISGRNRRGVVDLGKDRVESVIGCTRGIVARETDHAFSVECQGICQEIVRIRKAATSRGGGRKEEKKWEAARPKGRAFNMTATEAEEVPDVVAGTFLVNSTCARVLFDSRATCSFISPAFARCLGLKARWLGKGFDVETADDNQVAIREVFDGCMIDIEGSLVPVILYPMPMREFDVVLGMDWLDKNDASIICNKKLIRMVLPERGMVVIYGDRRERNSSLISMIKASRSLRKGCRGFLAYVIDAKKEKSSMEEVRVI
ncbi:hypothetical protein L6452_22843 [Arctium lappa]|uniref:Uncharacterized protein n=1 Tax=Arctium lappa TaxID=4217 RepID=A0ACB9B597_ARCLA|nr:hypothetical protein L6452_22843 [Arctium lappa]